MKKYYTNSFLLILLIIITSCNQQQDSPDDNTDNNTLAVEFISKKQIETSNQLITNIEYADFVNPDIIALISKSRLYANVGINTRTWSLEDAIDTLYYSEQIPVCEEVFQQTKIFYNGQQESIYESNIDPEGNPILYFHETPTDLDQYIARVEVKNGQRNCYNRSGSLLSSELAELPNMKEFIDELQKCVKQVEQDGLTRSAAKRDIEWLRRKMESQPRTRSGEDCYYKIEVLDNGNVVLEQEMQSENSKYKTRGISESGKITTRTELSPDISRTMGFEIRNNDLLVERRRYKYSESNIKTRSLYTPISEGDDLNPEQIITQKLVVLNDGTPMIELISENFTQNQTIFHFNNKK